MPEYLSPGVYMEEVEIGPRPIQGVSTSTAAMVGVTEWGPEEGLPQLVTSFAEYKAKFGGFLEEAKWGNARFLPYAVQGFFQNGGQRVYIKRVVGKGAAESALTLNNGRTAQLREDFQDILPGLRTARLTSLRGISVGIPLTFVEVDSNQQKREFTAKVFSYNEDFGEVSFYRSSPSGFKFSKAGTLVIVSDDAVPVKIDIKAKNKGTWGDRIQVQVEPSGKGFSTLVSRNEDTKEFKLTAAKLKSALELKMKIDPSTGGVVNFELISAAELRKGDLLELSTINKKLQRKIVDISGNIVTVDMPFPKDMSFEVNDTTITLLTVFRYIELNLAADIGKNDTTIHLVDASSLKEKDLVTIVNFEGESEDLEVAGITGNDIIIKGAAGFNYPEAKSEIYHTTRLLQVDNTSGLVNDDRVLITSAKDPLVVHEAYINFVDSVNSALQVSFVNPEQLKDVNYFAGDLVSLKKVARPGERTVRAASVNSFYQGASVELDNGKTKEYLTVDGIDEVNRLITFDKVFSHMYTAGDKIRICEYKFIFNNIPRKEPVLTEVFDNLNLNKSAKGYFAKVINAESKLVNIVDNEQDAAICLVTPAGRPTFLQSGNDGEIPGDKDYKGSSAGPGKRSGIRALEDIDDISIAAVPGITSQEVQNELINHCEIVMKDRFAVLDCGKGLDIEGVRAQRVLYNTAYGAIYYPWLRVQDPITAKACDVPPSGHVIGVYARSDVQRGVHKAPANEGIQGIVGVEVQMNKAENDILNSEGINAIRTFPGRGIMVWGARTMSDNTLWKYINVRRLFLFIEESIEQNTQWVVFEPNNEKLWARIKLTISQFLTRVWRDGALMGTKEDEAFFIRCDRTTMTQDDLDNGRLIVEIGVAPVKPAEFVVFRIAQWTGEAK